MPDPADWPDTAPVLGLPYLQPAQAQKHVTVNEALRTLDAVAQLAVADRDRTAPPALPAPGDRHIVAAGATGAWAGQDHRIALWEAPGAWVFLAPGPGWRAWVAAEGAVATFDGAAWAGPEALPLAADRLGLGGAAADATNRLAVASAATLLTHPGAGGGHQLKLNKAAAADTASLLFQTGFSGRAEMGTAGSDDFAVKVSADGAAWVTALSADRATGRAALPAGLTLPAGSAAAPAAAFAGDADTGLWHPAADAVGIAAGGAERVRVTAGGMQVTGQITGSAVAQSATDTTAGRLARVRDFGLGVAISLGAGDNLDALSAAGFYYNPLAANTPGNNYPVSAAGALWNLYRSATNHSQVFVTYPGAGAEPRAFLRSQGQSGWSAWREIVHAGALLGTVSQAGGVPTGRVIERGTNANGEYLRLADGTQICTLRTSASLAIGTAFLGGFRSAAQTWTYPVPFAAAPVLTVTPENLTAAAGIGADTPGTASAQWAVTAVASQGAATRAVALTATGRWF